jgi:hypothetical protein
MLNVCISVDLMEMGKVPRVEKIGQLTLGVEKLCIAFRPSAQCRASENVYEKYFGNANSAPNMFVKIFES